MKLPPNTHPILHSDHEWHYQNPEYQKRLKQRGVKQSMSRKGNCLDNSIMENFFGKLKMETIYLYEIKSLPELIEEIHNYIKYYNYYRIKENLNWMSPVDYRKYYQNVVSRLKVQLLWFSTQSLLIHLIFLIYLSYE